MWPSKALAPEPVWRAPRGRARCRLLAQGPCIRVVPAFAQAEGVSPPVQRGTRGLPPSEASPESPACRISCGRTSAFSPGVGRAVLSAADALLHRCCLGTALDGKETPHSWRSAAVWPQTECGEQAVWGQCTSLDGALRPPPDAASASVYVLQTTVEAGVWREAMAA